MNLEKMAFEFIQRLISEGKYKKAAMNLYVLAKANRMLKLKKKMGKRIRDAEVIEIYLKSGAVDEVFAKKNEVRLEQDLELALEAIRNKKNLKIPFSDKMEFKYQFDEDQLTKKEKKIVYDRITNLRELGFHVSVNPSK